MSTGLTKESKAESMPVAARNSQSTGLMNLVERLATDKEIDPDRVERAYAMYKEVCAQEAEQAFNTAMATAQSQINSVVAKSVNSHTKSTFAKLDAVHKEAKPIWTGCGLSVVTKTGRSDIQNHIKVICEVRHAQGHKEVHEDDWPLDMAGSQGKANKTAIQAKGSTTQYARRYTELMIFDISISHDDTDGNATTSNDPAKQTLNSAQINTLREEIKKAGVTEEALCKRASIDRIDDLQQGRLQGCIKSLQSGSKKQ